MNNKKLKKDSIANLDEISQIFEQDLLLKDLDKYTLMKLIINCLAQCIQDKEAKPPQFTINENFVFMEIEDLRYTIEVRDNNVFN